MSAYHNLQDEKELPKLNAIGYGYICALKHGPMMSALVHKIADPAGGDLS